MAQIYLLCGEDLFLIEKFEKDFIREKVDPEWESFNLEVIDAEKVNVDKIVEAADSPPFGFGNKVILVKNSHKIFEQDEVQLQSLADLLEKGLMETNFLIFRTLTIDKRKSFSKKLLKVAEIKEFLAIKQWDALKVLGAFAEDFVRKREKRIERKAVESLIEAVGTDRQRMEQELEKIISYIGENLVITHNDVQALVVNNEADLFLFLAFLGKKETGNALLQLRKLLLRENHLKLISSVFSNLRTVYNIKILADLGKGYNDISQKLNIKPFVVEKNLNTWRKFETMKLKESIGYLPKLEYSFKSSAVEPQLEIEKFVIRFFS